VEESKRPCKNSSSFSPAGPSVHTQLTSPRRITRSALTSIASISALAATSHFKYLLALSHSAALTAHHHQHHLATSSYGVHWPSNKHELCCVARRRGGRPDDHPLLASRRGTRPPEPRRWPGDEAARRCSRRRRWLRAGRGASRLPLRRSRGSAALVSVYS
jgi:hypothetical protein